MSTREPSAMRVSYDTGALEETDLAPDPLSQFVAWFDDAIDGQVTEPNAMVLSTAAGNSAPSSRTVLLKDVDARGFSFYTNLTSRKSSELLANPQASLLFPWYVLHRQVVITGTVEQVDRAEAAEYFSSRPRESQIGAWASRQSTVIDSRSVLEARTEELYERFGDDEVPLPDFWGGWRVVPTSIEFWHGRVSRLHDRLRFVRIGEGGIDHAESWRIERLSP